MKITLYIPCYNVEGDIGRCIEGVMKQSYPIEEIIIVDDGSTDRTVAIASQYPVRIIKHEKNKGLATARNTGVLNAQSEFVASIDADCEPNPDWLERLVGKFDSDNVAGVCGRLLEKYSTEIPDKWRAIHMRQNHGERFLKEAPSIFGNNNLFRKEAIISVGLYDERYRTNYEDMDLSKRLRKRGYRLVYDPDAIVWHYRRDTIRSVLEAKWRYRGFGTRVKPNLLNLIGYTIGYFGVSSLNLVRDFLKGDFSLIPIDVMDGFYSSFLGFMDYLRRRD